MPSPYRVPMAAFVLLAAASAASAQKNPDDAQRLFRERIEPVLKSRCYECHSAAAVKIQGGLRLDSGPGIRRGGDSGPVIWQGLPQDSLLLQAIRHENGYAMPPDDDKLPDSVIADFVTWIKSGATDPRTSEPDLPVRSDPRQHWSFQPVSIVEPPLVGNTDWVRNPIDAFVLAAIEQQGWSPATETSRSEWIRRVTFDLTGLPPSPAEIHHFLQDASEGAYETVVDRLLASPHYGERQAQHWLDVIRFAETEGYEYDGHLPDAWRFRDYVIESFADDKSFREFVTEQIAGDEIAGSSSSPHYSDNQIAAVFHRLGPVRRNAGNPDIALSRNEVLTERTDIIGTSFLALSIGCARCHDHKLEPIEQRDYYRLQAYLAATEEHNIRLASTTEVEVWTADSERIKRRQTQLRQAAKAAEGARKRELEEQAEALEDQLPPPPPTIPGIRNDFEKRTPIHVLKRGVWENKGESVGPRPPSVLVAHDLPELAADIPNPRTHLARWLVADDNPLTPRVLVNRLWQQHFGRGIVSTSNDFGTHGDRPSHPELLDWLAGSFRNNGWHVKPIHRLIVLSSTYRQSSRSEFAAVAHSKDPDNRLLWHVPRRRLSAEELRDAMLQISGRLNATTGGPSIMPPVDPSFVQLLYKPSQWKVPADAREHDRRTIYLMAKRNLRLPFLETFDAPTLLTSCARRDTSTHAPQALELLNGRLSNDLAKSLADHLRDAHREDPDRLVRDAFVLVIGRTPTAAEFELSRRFLKQQPLAEFALALFNLNEFLYVP